MVDSEKLKEKVRESGYKLLHVAAACGLTYAGFLKKITNETEFKASEIMALKRYFALQMPKGMQFFLPLMYNISTNER